MTRGGPARVESAKVRTLRLKQLYEISTLLTRFDEDALSRIAALLAEALPLRSVIMVLEDRAGTRRATILWPDQAGSPASEAEAERAEKSYAYLAGEAARPPSNPPGAAADGRPEFLTLPLVVQHSPMFGVLQLETPTACAEEDLLFANTVANQLAVALDRRLAIEERQAATEAKTDRAEEQLGFSRAITEGLGEGVIAIDLEGRITFLNPAAAGLFGVREEETVGADLRTALQLQHDGSPVTEENRPAFLAMRTGKAVNSDDYLIVQRRDGVVPVSCTAAPLRRAGQISGAVIVFQDITERKRMEEVRRAADSHKNEFLAMLGHELRNPLAPIASAAHVLRIGDTASQQRAADIIERQADRMGRMIDELLDVARIATGRIELHRRRIDLRRVVDEAIETVRPLINRRGHELNVILPPEPLWVHGDADRLQQVVANLLDNAAKYTAPGGSLAAIGKLVGDNVVLRVRDNGPGIDAELVSRIFDLFSQGERPSDRSQGGLGIGLALVKQIVDMHGGTIAADTLPGGGSEFTVRLALADRETESAAGPGAEASAAESAGQLRILVVDDSIDTAEAMAMLLRSLKHEVQTAYDGPTAMEAAVDFRPDTVFLDIGLPEIDGYETARRLRKHSELRHAVLVALTGYGQAMDRQQSREAGFDHHLTKPASFEDIRRILGTRPL